jgi:hypothetical protein
MLSGNNATTEGQTLDVVVGHSPRICSRSKNSTMMNPADGAINLNASTPFADIRMSSGVVIVVGEGPPQSFSPGKLTTKRMVGRTRGSETLVHATRLMGGH